MGLLDSPLWLEASPRGKAIGCGHQLRGGLVCAQPGSLPMRIVRVSARVRLRPEIVMRAYFSRNATTASRSPACNSAAASVSGNCKFAGHGRALLGLDPPRQADLLALIERRGLSVRQVEELARRLREEPGTAGPARRSRGGRTR